MHRHAVAKLAIDGISNESLQVVQERAEDALDDLLALYRPWQFDAKSKEEKEKQEYKGLRSGWQKFFGSLDDPEVSERVAELRAALLRKKSEQEPAPGAPMQAAGIFNKDTAAHLSNLQELGQGGIG